MLVGKAISDIVTGIQSDCKDVLHSPEGVHDVAISNRAPNGLTNSRSDSANTRVFIVHGHDEEAKEAVARCVEKLGLEAVVLHERANRGRTIIEKFERHADVSFVVALLTPDDVGADKDNANMLRPRARQNVVLELGFFIGRLGRERVCALHKGGVEIPSDISGFLWIPLDPNGAWRVSLAKEMKDAGLQVDLNRLS